MFTDSAASWELLIGGSDRIANLSRDSLRGQASEGRSVDSLTFELNDNDGSLAVDPMMEVYWKADGAAIYGGEVYTVKSTSIAGARRRLRVEVMSWNGLVNRIEAAAQTYVDMSYGAIAAAIFTDAGLSEFDTSGVAAGGTAASFGVGAEETVGTAMDRLATLAGFIWNIRADKTVQFEASSTTAAPFEVGVAQLADWHSGGDIYPVEGDLSFEKSADVFYNRIVVSIGDKPSAVATDTFSGDASTYLFVLANKPLVEIVDIFVDGSVQVHGTWGYDDALHGAGVDVLVDYEGGALYWPAGAPPASGADNIVVRYRYNVPVKATASSAAGYAAANDRWLTKRVYDPKLSTLEQAQAAADSLLAEYASFAQRCTLTVRRMGIAPGDELTIHTPAAIEGVVAMTVRELTWQYDPASHLILCAIQAGGRSKRLSNYINNTSPSQRVYNRPRVPSAEGEAGVLRVRTRVELLKTGTQFSWPT